MEGRGDDSSDDRRGGGPHDEGKPRKHSAYVEPMLQIISGQLVRGMVALVGWAIVAAIVPLTFGVLAAAVSGAVYAWQLAGADLGNFFGAAAQVGVGLLIALAIEGVTRESDANEGEPLVHYLLRSLRIGAGVLTAIGTTAALTGLLASGTIITGVAFALTWGGLAAGLFGLLVFVGDLKYILAGPGQDPPIFALAQVFADRHKRERGGKQRLE
jgi:hypothetical protein